MKLITAYIQPNKLHEVKDELYKAEIFKMSVSNVLGAGQQKGYTETYRGVAYEVNLLKKVKIEIAVNDDFVQPTIDAIIKGARTGEIGDGKILVTALEEVIRIRSGEKGEVAIG
jgi:nitrogen regulatory protein P-II 2